MQQEKGMVAEDAEAAPWTQDYAAEMVSAWRASGQSVARWCREQQVIPHRIHYWRRRLEELIPGHAACALTPIIVRQEAATPVAIVLDNGLRLEVSAGCDLPFLRQVVEVLR